MIAKKRQLKEEKADVIRYLPVVAIAVLFCLLLYSAQNGGSRPAVVYLLIMAGSVGGYYIFRSIFR